MSAKKRSLREITNLVKRLRSFGAISIKIDEIELTFLPDEVEASQKVVDTVKDIVHVHEKAKLIKDPLDAQMTGEEDDPDLYLSATNE